MLKAVAKEILKLTNASRERSKIATVHRFSLLPQLSLSIPIILGFWHIKCNLNFFLTKALDVGKVTCFGSNFVQ